VASSSGDSSQPVGFFGHATKLVSSMLGVSKKTKTEPPKSIQLAAAAAKKVIFSKMHYMCNSVDPS